MTADHPGALQEPSGSPQPPPEPGTADAEPTLDEPAEVPWRRLAPGMLLVEPVREVIKFIPMLIALVFAGRVGGSGPPWGLIATAAVIALGIGRYATTRYRITPSVVEVRRGVFQRKHLTVPRDRVRTVDVSAHPLQRLLRLVKVQIGTGTSHQGSEAVALDGLPAAAAGALRAELLHRSTPRPIIDPPPGETELLTAGEGPNHRAPTTTVVPTPAGEAEVLIARLNPRWIGYAPATLSGVVTGAVLIGLGWRIVNEAQLDPTQFEAIDRIADFLRTTTLWLDVVVISTLVLVAVTLLSVAGYVLSFWGYALSRHARGTLQVSRGLLTTRSTTIEERRLRGVDRAEPLLMRWFGGARLNAIATGLRQRGSEGGSSVLVPPAPRETVLAVEATVLGSTEIGRSPLIAHGPAARRRRYTRALGMTAALAAGLFGLSLLLDRLLIPAVLALLALPLAALLARDRYRNLGHAVVDDRLITQAGSLARHRSVLAVSGVIGVTLRQSSFQRRAGLVSLTATTAAGAQHYDVRDLPEPAALELAVRLVPELRSFVSPGPQTMSAGPLPDHALLRDKPGVTRLPA